MAEKVKVTLELDICQQTELYLGLAARAEVLLTRASADTAGGAHVYYGLVRAIQDVMRQLSAQLETHDKEARNG
ncbi:hypothetical protein CVH13_01448 [Dehalococcoides mccartyi]|uniref:Uncharacterized protein n=1 Tax=Dehalococcoides mccartyi TaxID=61435 RepID=A0A2J1DU18_9CHLR|nr:hypothetical protein CVH13_01448 [Dehalococcoides mccartyi]